jgi:hypothetical protein
MGSKNQMKEKTKEKDTEIPDLARVYISNLSSHFQPSRSRPVPPSQEASMTLLCPTCTADQCTWQKWSNPQGWHCPSQGPCSSGTLCLGPSAFLEGLPSENFPKRAPFLSRVAILSQGNPFQRRRPQISGEWPSKILP